MAWVILAVLLAGGIVLTLTSGGVQLRYFAHMLKTVLGSRKGAGADGISSFQAFALGLADRVGTGNIAGVAIALSLGGPGAIFWMWVVAFLGMSTAFLESTLAQIYKVRNPDGTFRGGPAFYLRDGLGLKKLATVFAVCLILTKGFAFEMLQANTVATVASDVYDVPKWTMALILFLFSAPFIIGGVKPVARLTEFLAPVMAVAYLLLAVAMLIAHASMIPTVIGWIFTYAFGIHSITGGVIGGIVAALVQGTRRGLLSNEAGMGTVPNAAATATVNHPAKQGFIQSLGVFADTMVVCTCTAFIIMVSGLYTPGAESTGADGATMTLQAVGTLGEWTTPLMLVIIIVFGYSTMIGNYAYAEGNIKFLFGIDCRCRSLKTLVLAGIVVGSIIELDVVWAIADWMSAICAIMNIYAVVRLSKWAIGALRDYQAQLRGGTPIDDITFIARDNPHLPGNLAGDVWSRESWAASVDARAKDAPADHEDFLAWLVRQRD
ncbi:alanine:cation symporter family protein [Nanchangia anserum]|uniref:Alanine:cation symporter family protein n=1 Tax=Nanchangia anserum TaxID=2692125 RepID=A0A8I0GAW9_9ACTO|nr:alanine/glycine:cation symporter family protein [Nanchangia anserum]MBD3688906.1 alanine:cation symporter family protein [Nanchangia anserum]QOX81171.1 alanine:cation symporter family protein [Nanchangia anserum]